MSESTPWKTKFTGLLCALGAPTFFPLAVPYRGTVDRLVCSQEAGSLDGFSLDVFDTIKAMLGTTTDNIEHAKVFDTLSAGASAAYLAATPKADFINQDGSPTNGQRFLYAKITPLSPGVDKIFNLSLTIGPPLLQ